jgi:hypothetical protein
METPADNNTYVYTGTELVSASRIFEKWDLKHLNTNEQSKWIKN